MYYDSVWGTRGLKSVVDHEPIEVMGVSMTARTFAFGEETPSFGPNDVVHHLEAHIGDHHRTVVEAFKSKFKRDVEKALKSEGKTKSFRYLGSHLGSHGMIAAAFEDGGVWSLLTLIQMTPEQEEGATPIMLEEYVFKSKKEDSTFLRITLVERDLNAVLALSPLPIDEVKNGDVLCSLEFQDPLQRKVGDALNS